MSAMSQKPARPASQKPKPWVLIFFGLFILWGFGWETIGRRLQTDVDGVIVGSQDVPSTGAPRYATRYTVRGPDGNEQVFWAGATDASLPRSMPVGTRIRKRRWHLDYEQNGRHVDFIPEKYFYDLVLACGVGMTVWGVFLWRSQGQ
jgi:hypothetical protein